MITPPPSRHPDVYVVSLKSAPVRREGMERQAARLREAGYTGNVVFFEATDAARREHLAVPQYSPFWANVAGTPLTDGERACFASHYRLWKKCAEERPASGMVVLEDDAEILPEAFVETVEECVRASWECVRIFVTNERPFRRIEGNFYTCEKGGNGTVGYFLRPSAAEKFLRASARWLRLADDFLDRYWEHGVAYVVRRPYPLRLLGLESAIDAADGATRGDAGRYRRRRAWWARPFRELFRFVERVKKMRGRRKLFRELFG